MGQRLSVTSKLKPIGEGAAKASLNRAFSSPGNQLFPSLIGLSPLSTSHPNLLQQMRVRSSSWCYPTFNLLMARSLGFGSNATNYGRPIQTRFRCAYTYRLKLASYTKSLTHYTKGTPSGLRPPTVCRQPVSGSISLPSPGCFSPFQA